MAGHPLPRIAIFGEVHSLFFCTQQKHLPPWNELEKEMVREPNFAHYPKMKFPKEVQKQAKRVEEVTKAWAEEDGLYADCELNLRKARQADALALKEAALAGEADPGYEATLAAERALLYQEERLKAAARVVSKESVALKQLFHQYRIGLLSTACEMADATVEEFQADVAEIGALMRKAEQKRHEGLAPLRWVSSLTDSAVQYDPNFPMSGDFRLPNTAEVKVSGIVALLRKIYLDRNEDEA